MRQTDNRRAALCTEAELKEVQAVLGPMRVKLLRTYNQKLLDGSRIRFWRVISPASHPNYNSDLSVDGLKEWGII